MSRARNPRGQGDRLRLEILSAARQMIERNGEAHSLTLRSIAREAGIAAPSIYSHFADVDAIVDALVEDVFDDMIVALSEGVQNTTPGRERLEATCVTYLRFARERPSHYRLLFARPAPPLPPVTESELADGSGRRAFQFLIDGVLDLAPDADPRPTATAIWCGLHGAAVLRLSTPRFDWPDDDLLIRALIGMVSTP